jgi:uncharacterized repeat protein (TIGR03809 family)
MDDSKSTTWRPDAFARKWHALAQRRRNHLAELYQSGEWQRYYSEERLRSHMREAVREVEHWSAMLGDQPAAEAAHLEAPSSNPRAA